MGDLNVSALRNAMSANDNFTKEVAKKNDDFNKSIFIDEERENQDDGYFKVNSEGGFRTSKGFMNEPKVDYSERKSFSDEIQGEEDDIPSTLGKIKNSSLSSIIKNFMDKFVSDEFNNSLDADNAFKELNDKMKLEYQEGLDRAYYESVQKFLREAINGDFSDFNEKMKTEYKDSLERGNYESVQNYLNDSINEEFTDINEKMKAEYQESLERGYYESVPNYLRNWIDGTL